jgi:peptidoglycan/LPS O-acetylase OafA/YrhL
LIRAVPEQSWLVESITGCGYLGVDLFFTLSGFILAYNYGGLGSRLQHGTYFRYLWLRLARIYPVHLFTLLLFVAAVFGARILDVPLTMPQFYNTADFFRNLLLIQAWELPVRPSWNTLSWSVSCEWLAYLTLPIWLVLHRGRDRRTRLLLYALLAAALVFCCDFIQYNSTFGYGLIRIAFEFNLGIIAYHLFTTKFLKNLHWNAVITSSIILAFAAPYLISQFDIPLFALAPVFGVVILGLAYENNLYSRILSWRPIVYGGSVSYSFYMIHEIILLVARKSYLYLPNSQQPFANLVWVPLVLLVTVISAICIYHFIEEPSRLFMRRKFFSSNRN